MQATVSKFDERTGAGAVLTDRGVEIPFTAEAFAVAGVRFLRPGQRVRIDTEGSGASIAITGLHFITLP